VKKLNSHKHK